MNKRLREIKKPLGKDIFCFAISRMKSATKGEQVSDKSHCFASFLNVFCKTYCGIIKGQVTFIESITQNVVKHSLVLGEEYCFHSPDKEHLILYKRTS